jgi:predicted Holliday junction resolvase-like endonuclease
MEWIIIVGLVIVMYIVIYKYEKKMDNIYKMVQENKENIQNNHKKINKNKEDINEHYNHIEKLWIPHPKSKKD